MKNYTRILTDGIVEFWFLCGDMDNAIIFS